MVRVEMHPGCCHRATCANVSLCMRGASLPSITRLSMCALARNQLDHRLDHPPPARPSNFFSFLGGPSPRLGARSSSSQGLNP